MNEQNNDNIEIMAVGDIMMGCAYFHSLVNESIPDILYDTNKSLIHDDVVDILNNADLLFGNLECVISSDFSHSNDNIPPRLMAPVESLPVLNQAGFDVLNLANNHILDHGPEYVEETVKLLELNGINHIGNPLEETQELCFEKNNQNICFLGYHIEDDTDEMNREKIVSDIKLKRSENSIMIVSLHWGHGNVHMRSPSPEQVSLARHLIDQGADIILGHHSHTFQPVEKYKEGLIVYSLGNFIFDMWRKENRSSGILKITIDDDLDISTKVIPIEQIDYQVRLTSDDFIRQTLDKAVNGIPNQEYQRKAKEAARKQRFEVIQQYILNCYKFPLEFHIATWKRWKDKAIDKILR